MLRIYNTLSREQENFKPVNSQQVGLYTCGPTVYNYAHIGNLRTFVFEDILKRVLKYNGFKVMHVMNITDVGHLTDDADAGEDKMEKGARREGKSAYEIAEFYTQEFKKNIEALNVLEPSIWCKATDHIPEQIDFVQKLIDGGHAYQTTDGIYFDTTSIDDYGKLAHLKEQELRAGARVDMGEKKNPHDFALWKFTPASETRHMEWDAFGKKGFPGWHIECSAMSVKYLGEHFDIHCGGIDHLPVHHTNEIAQTEAVTGKKPWVNYWVHGEFLLIDEDKMAKSGENFITLDTLIQKGYDPLAYRYFLLQAHYRKQLNFSWEALDAAAQGLKRLKKTVHSIEPNVQPNPKLEKEFMAAMNDDLNTPEALAVLWHGLKEKTINLETVSQFDKVLGLRLRDIPVKETTDIPEKVQKLIEKRATARANHDWEASDTLRDQILELGFVVNDTETGQDVVKK